MTRRHLIQYQTASFKKKSVAFGEGAQVWPAGLMPHKDRRPLKDFRLPAFFVVPSFYVAE